MNLGRFHIAAICLCLAAIVLSGCGSDSPSTSTTADATADTGSTAATGETSTAKKKKSSSKSKSSNASSGDAKKDSPVTKYNNPTVQTTAPDELKPPSDQKAAVRDAFNKNIDAIRNGDVDYLCDTAYSTAFAEQLDAKGGCKAATTKQIAGITAYSSKITAISRYPNSNLIAVYADFEFTNATGKHKSKGGLYFKTENDQWVRAVPPKA
jgi:hypothetical protein